MLLTDRTNTEPPPYYSQRRELHYPYCNRLCSAHVALNGETLIPDRQIPYPSG